MTENFQPGAKAQALVAFSTVNNHESAQKIAHELIQQHLAACVNIVPGVESIYFWDNDVCEDNELLLIIKTTTANIEKTKEILPQIHPYKVPELVFLPVVNGLSDYLNWIFEVTEKNDG